MYEYIEGRYKGLSKDCVIIDNNGIGYKIFTSGNSIFLMPPIDETVKLYVEQIVRQDFIGLYGFINKEELEMFLKLININGIGTKASLSLLSVNTVDTLKKAIYYSDENILMKASGVGKKSAQRIILELKDKLDFNTQSEMIEELSFSNTKEDEVMQALQALGFEEREVKKVISSTMIKFSEESIENIIKECLKNLMR